MWQQAKTAAAERPGAAGILAYVEAHQPPGAGKDSGAINGWEAMQEVAAAIDQIEFEVLEDPAFSDDFGTVRPDFSLIETGIRENLEPETRASEQLMLDAALAVLAELREQDVLAELDALADHRRAVNEFTIPIGQPVVFVGLPYLGDARQLARLNAARMHLAWEAGDRDEFLAAFESGLAIARYCDHQPFLIGWLVGTAIEALILERARVCLLQQPGIDWIEGIEAAIERQRAVLPPDYWIRGYSLFMHDTIAWFFADPDRARFGRFSRELNILGGGFDISEVWNKRLGTYAENRDIHAAYMRPYLDVVGTDAYARPAIAPTDTNNLLLADSLIPTLGRALQIADQRTARARAITIMLALERFRVDHGNYPASLDELVPGYLADLPLDPWSGKPFRYFLLTRPGTHPHYGLYAFGLDMDDDGGRRRTSKIWNDSDMVFSPAED
ncbi:type II secretion system protein GspG [bacterium AH-315-K20]|nr:type II secretion system protein GspG [bacterium AH-315-K20]